MFIVNPFRYAVTGYQPAGAVWLDGTNDYFTRTFGSGGNVDKWTYSVWLKYHDPNGDALRVWSINGGSTNAFADFRDSTTIINWYAVEVSGAWKSLRTTGYYGRDPNAWQNLVLVYDTGNSTEGDRLRIYQNGTRITAFGTANYPAQDQDGQINGAILHRLFTDNSSNYRFKGYVADIVFLDNVATTDCSEFGEIDDDTGIWVPKDPSDISSFGTTGFWLDFSDGADIGNDVSGNNNDFTPSSIDANNIIAGGPANSEDDGIGNYCIWNPLTMNINASSSLTLSDGNLVVSNTASEDANVHGSFGLSSGKWYFEVTVNTINEIFLGVSDATIASNANAKTEAGAFVLDLLEADKYNNDGGSSYGSAFSNSDVANVAIDLDNGKIWIGKDGTYPNSGNPATGSNEMYSGISGTVFPFLSTQGSGTKQATTNFGQSSFTTSAPSGFKAVATHNMTEPTIAKPSDYFQVIAYEGTSASTLTVNTNFQADWVWIKERTNSRSWHMYDSVRGPGKSIYSNGPWVEDTNEVNGYLDQLNATNVRLTNGDTSGVNVKGSSDSNTYVMYCMKVGGAPTTDNISDSGSPGQTPTSGSVYIDGSVSTAALESAGTYPVRMSVNTTTKMSLLTYKAGSATTIPHGLGVKPNCIFIKNLTSAKGWRVGFFDYDGPALTTDPFGFLDADSSAFNSGNADHLTSGNVNTFSIDGDNGVSGNASWTHLAWVMSSVEGFSKFGTYTGNGAADGPFVYTGFKPAFIMFKNSNSTTGWHVLDATRNPYNPVGNDLYAQTGSIEYDTASSGTAVDFLSNGFKVRVTGAGVNGSGNIITYIAFAETPFASNNRAR